MLKLETISFVVSAIGGLGIIFGIFYTVFQVLNGSFQIEIVIAVALFVVLLVLCWRLIELLINWEEM